MVRDDGCPYRPFPKAWDKLEGIHENPSFTQLNVPPIYMILALDLLFETLNCLTGNQRKVN
jgi:hypothetical protein